MKSQTLVYLSRDRNDENASRETEIERDKQDAQMLRSSLNEFDIDNATTNLSISLNLDVIEALSHVREDKFAYTERERAPTCSSTIGSGFKSAKFHPSIPGK
ncbi:hypothetical protein V6N13_080192 [Hibiscus sabdariffa]